MIAEHIFGCLRPIFAGFLLLLGVCVLFSGVCVSGLSPAFAEDPSSLVFVFQKQKRPDQVKSAADEVAKYLSGELEMPVKAVVPSNYSASVQALVSRQADFAYTSSLPFLLARRDGKASMILAEQRQDPQGSQRTEYDSIFVVRKDSPLKSIEDLLKESKKQRMVFTSPTSTSGYVFAYWRLVKEKLLSPKQDPKDVFKSVGFAGSYTAALEQVLNDRADVCAVSYYTLEGPKSAKYLSEEQQSKLRVLARTPGVPTHLISARAGLSEGLKKKVRSALLKMGKDRPELLEDVYGTAQFVEIPEGDHVANTVQAVEFLGLPIHGLVKKKRVG